MKFLTILLIFFASSTFASLRVQLKTDYLQKGGIVYITLKGDEVTVLEDRNRCILNQFGEPSACTEMAFLPYDSPIKLIKESKDRTKKIFDIVKSEKYRLMITKDKARLLEMDVETGATAASYALLPQYLYP